MLLIARPALANSPGGFTNLVATPVTTGTDSFKGHTDHFLDNGILHVEVASNGNVESIKYLQPGNSGTPLANGTEMISQTGVSTGGFGNHYYIYYYFYPDGSQDSAYLGATATSARADLAYKRTYNSTTNLVAADFEIHYVLGQGETALYVYLAANHPASYPECDLAFIQMIWPAAHDSVNFLCEKSYIDTVKTGLSLNGTQLNRISLEPTFSDVTNSVNVSGLPKEIFQATTGFFNGQLYGKYSYNFDYAKLGAWGRASDVNHVGEWILNASAEYMNNGPTMCEYSHGEGLMYNNIVSNHYDNVGITIAANATWNKVFGPWALYFNSQSTGDLSWQDAKNQAAAEKSAWPYPWLATGGYASAAQRATVTGHLIINDTMRPGSSAAGAWVGLAAPESATENAPDNWQFQSDRYQYWVQADANGNFTIPDVCVTDTYGQPANYTLYAYSAGTSNTTGSIGEFAQNLGSALTANTTTNLGNLTWNVPHPGASLVWDIGIPDRTAAEFRHGDEYAKPNLWANFTNEFTNPLEYNVADNNWATALNYVHSVDNVGAAPWKWHLNFNLTTVVTGNYWLNIAYAAPSSIQVIRVNDDSTIFTSFTPANADPGASTYVRQGIHSKYSIAHIAIPSSKLHVGSNTITLDHEVHSTHATACFMYDYIDFEAPAIAPGPPSSGRNITWSNAPPSSTWDNGTTNSFLVNSSATSFGTGDAVTFDNSGSNTSNILLNGTLTPNQVNFTGTKNYTLAGNGTLSGAMVLTKSGAGVLTIAPALVAVSNCNVTANSATVVVPSTTGLAVGMLVTVNTNNASVINDGVTIASIPDSTHLMLSQNAVRGNTSVNFNCSVPFTYNGGTVINGGTVALGSVNANDAGLGAGPVTLNGGTLSLYNWNGSNLPGSGTFPNSLIIEGNGTILAAQRHAISSTVSGGGNLTLNIPYVRTDLTGDWSQFFGTLTTVTSSSNMTDLRFASANGMPQALVTLGNNTQAYFTGIISANGTTISLGALSGGANTILKGGPTSGRVLTWSIGGRGTDAIFAGNITEQGSGNLTALNKAGTGTWTLSGTLTYAGNTTVSAGTLVLTSTLTNNATLHIANGGTFTLANGTLTGASVLVDNGGALNGQGILNAPLVNNGVVSSGANQTLTLNGSVTNNGYMYFTGGTALACTGAFVNNGILDLVTGAQTLPANFTNHGTVLFAGDAQIQSCAYAGGQFNVVLQSYSGHDYQLQRSDSLTAPDWQNIGDPQPGVDDLLTLADATGTAGPIRFYRVVVNP